MKNFTFKLLFLFLLLTTTKHFAQCGNGTVTLSSQLAVDNFMSTIPGCSQFTGSLDIGGPDISDLSPLSTLTFVTGNIRIWNCPLLTNLQGLHNLTSVGGNFTLTGYNFPITNLDGLSSLQSVGGQFYIDALQSLTSMDGLTSLTNVGANFIIDNCNNISFTSISIPSLTSVGYFYLNYNNKLTSIDFSGLHTVGKNFNIVANALLASADFSSLETVGLALITELEVNTGFFEIRVNFNLLNVDFSSLTSIRGRMDIIQNLVLQSLGFQNLTSILRDIRINSNTALNDISGLSQLSGSVTSLLINGSSLTDLDALSNLTSIGALDYGDLIISNNTLLTDVTGLGNIATVNRSVEIVNNALLPNLDGLNGLSTIAKQGLIIKDNPLLTNIDGLQNLVSVALSGTDGNIQIINNSSLTSLGFLSLNALRGSLIIQNNLLLSDVSDIKLTTSIPACNCGLTISNNDALQNLTGMVVPKLNGYVQISNNDALESIDFTITNPSIVAFLSMVNNPALQSLSGLSNITKVNSSGFSLINNDSLENLEGLNLTAIFGDYVYIKDNASLKNIDALESVLTLSGNTALEIKNNAALVNVNGLKHITTAGKILVQDNPMLLNIDGLSGITQLTTTSETRLLSIYNNLNLESIQGIRNISPASIWNLVIYSNPKVSVCDLKNICQYLATTKPRSILSNQSGCNSVAEVQSSCPTIWNGSAWSDGVPTDTRSALIEGDLNLSTTLSAKNFTVNSGIFKILSDASLNVSGSVVNNLQPENFIVENNGNLVQPGLASLRKNDGAIKVYAENAPFKRLDYTLWSSPVQNQNLFAFSPLTINGVTNYIGSTGRIYTYEGASGYVNSGPFTENDVMNSGKGYLFRAPNNWSATVASAYEGKFIGVPNNGTAIVSTHLNNYTSIGNPYPSTIDALELFAVNPNLGALYFWTNTNPAVNGTYTQNNYASYTAVGGVSASGSGIEPTQYIAVGQGFVAYNSATQVTFTNDMRCGNSANFFKTTTVEKSRFWLNLKRENDVECNQILLSYMSGATDGFDSQMDGKLFGYEGSALYSVIENEKYSIQAKGLPFLDSDIIPLGFKAENTGNFTISLGNFDGLFMDGNVTIFLKDNQTNEIHNLMESPYDFQSDSGTFDERFEVVLQSTLETETPNLESNLLIYKNQNLIVFKSSQEIQKITIYDLLGRIVYTNESINKADFQINSSEFGKQILLISVECNGLIKTQKLIN